MCTVVRTAALHYSYIIFALRIERYKLYILGYEICNILNVYLFLSRSVKHILFYKQKEALCLSSWVFVSIVLPSKSCFSPVQCVMCPV